KGLLHFRVRDTGIGISEGDKERIFKAFAQADLSTTRQYGGTGLGLTISKALANKMGGDVTVESALSKGSVFDFHIEIEYKPDYTEQKEKLPICSALVCDDNLRICEILQQYLGSWGIETTYCHDGLCAQKILKENTFDLLIIDSEMPDQSSLYTLKLLFNSNLIDINKTQVIMLTTLIDESVIYDTFEGHVKNLKMISKPVNKRVLLHTIKDRSAGRYLYVTKTAIETDVVSQDKLADLQKTIMIVEDVIVNTLLVNSMINSLMPKAKVVAAKNGREAIDVFKANEVDLILMDVQMPEMDGLEATRSIREIQQNRKVPIVALTAGALKEERDRALEAGMDDFLAKPIETDSLRRLFERFFIQSERSPENRQDMIVTCEHFDSDGYMKSIENNPEIKAKMFELCKVKLSEFMKDLQDSITNRDFEKGALTAHSVKGMARTMRFLKLADLSHEMELQLNERNLDSVNCLLISLLEEVEIIRQILDS
ncbi:MAG: response regulator, partial [Thermodesulfovibrionales bacterium]